MTYDSAVLRFFALLFAFFKHFCASFKYFSIFVKITCSSVIVNLLLPLRLIVTATTSSVLGQFFFI